MPLHSHEAFQTTTAITVKYPYFVLPTTCMPSKIPHCLFFASRPRCIEAGVKQSKLHIERESCSSSHTAPVTASVLCAAGPETGEDRCLTSQDNLTLNTERKKISTPSSVPGFHIDNNISRASGT